MDGSGKRSYIKEPRGLEEFYVSFSTVKPKGRKWTVYMCGLADCIFSERYAAIKQDTGLMLTAGMHKEIIDKVFNWEINELENNQL